jgi:hypothetical protein
MAPSISSNITVSAVPTVLSINGSQVPTIPSNGTGNASPSPSPPPVFSSLPPNAVNATSLVPTIVSNVTSSLVPTIASNKTASLVPTIALNRTTSLVPTITSNGTASLVPTIASNGTASLSPTVASNGTASLVPTIASNGTASIVPTASPAPTIANGTASLLPTISSNGTASLVPTVASNGTASLVPTIASQGPPGSLYFEGFENGQFPVAPWLSEGDALWEINTDLVKSGTYSIKSGALDLTDLTTKYSNLTFLTNTDWPDGSLILSTLVGTSLPIDELSYFVDGEFREKLNQSNEWTQLRIPLSPGSHTIVFSYISNPLGLAELPPPPDDHIEAVYFDNVYFIPFGVTSAPTEVSLKCIFTHLIILNNVLF